MMVTNSATRYQCCHSRSPADGRTAVLTEYRMPFYFIVKNNLLTCSVCTAADRAPLTVYRPSPQAGCTRREAAKCL